MQTQQYGTVELPRGELVRLAEEAGRALGRSYSKHHVRYVIRGEREPSAALARQLAELNEDVGRVLRERWPELFEEPETPEGSE